MKKFGKILIITGVLIFLGVLLLKFLYPGGFKIKFLLFSVSFHDPLKPINLSINLIFSGTLLVFIAKDTWPGWKIPVITMFTITSVLKIMRYEFFLAPGYDLGNYVSILHNIYHHGKLLDSLNQVHAFSGHIRPFLFPVSLIFLIKESPVTLLVLQAAVVSLTVPVLLRLSRFYGLDARSTRLLVALFMSNIYLHHVNGFDFHLEAFAIPLVLMGIYYYENGSLIPGVTLMFLTLTLKEDMAITWLSVGIFYMIVRKEWRRGMVVSGIAVFYGIIALYLMIRYADIQTMQKAHYSSVPHIGEVVKSGIRFLSSIGFLPLFVPGTLFAWILPLFEHLLSSRPHHFKIQFQYSANLLPVVFWSVIFTLRKNTVVKKWLTVFAILFSIFQSPLKLYVDLSKVSLSRRACIRKVLSEIPVNARISCGNHISPHLATRDGVYQFPIINRADIVILDTTWHDFTPVDEDSAWKLIRALNNGYRVESICGLLIFRRKSHSVFSGFFP